MNDALNPGTGAGDVFALIPNQLFTSSNPNPYVYLYSSFGQQAAANNVYEEWAVLPVVTGRAASPARSISTPTATASSTPATKASPRSPSRLAASMTWVSRCR